MGLFYSEDENVVVHVSRIFAIHILAVKLFVLPFYKESSCYMPITTGGREIHHLFPRTFSNQESNVAIISSFQMSRAADAILEVAGR